MDGTPGDEFIFAATEVGPYVYVKSENTWFDLGEGIAPNQNYWSLDYIESTKTARFVTYGRGAWDFRVQTPLSTPLVNSSPTRMFPNPANDKIKLNYNLSSSPYIYFYGCDGKLVMKYCCFDSNEIDVSEIPTGTYFINFDSIFSKLIISR
jgi:hypothetical protein